MTAQEAEAKGYQVVVASPFEVGLVKDGHGIRTWWCQTFDRLVPGLDHPEIQKAININEEMEQQQKDSI